MKKYFSSALFVLAIAVSIFVTNLLLPHHYPLFLNSAEAQEVLLRNGYSKITLPDVGEQNDSWSCGPNSAARVLKFYDYRVTYGVMKGYIKIAQNIPGFESFGTTPSELRNAMQNFTSDVRLEREASFEKLIGLVSRGIPVITLVRLDSFKPAGFLSGTWPQLHWYVVSGYDVQSKRVYITDTISRNSEWKPYDEFKNEWAWGIGRGAASSTLSSNGIKTRTMVWIDRTPTPTVEAELRSELNRPSAVGLRGIVHLQNIGDVSFQGGAFAGTRGASRRLEGFSLAIADGTPNLGIQYMAHLQNIGDTTWVNGGQVIGTRGESRRLEGFAIRLTGSAAANYNIRYICHLQDIGDTQVRSNGEFCGTRGESRRLEGLQVWIERK